MLEYENQMFLDILHEDGLVIAAKGLGIETVLLNLIKVYCDPGNLVIVLGATTKEEEYYISQLEEQGVNPVPKIITTEYNAAEREQVYLDGGVLFVSPRILVVDLLKDRVPIQHITGFLVCRAHGVLESCQEAFAIRLYRQKNKTGFVKAFSNSPQAFTVGFARVGHIMKTLFVCNLYLWPRFHATVKASLEKCKPKVLELSLSLTPTMLQIQTAVLDLMNFTVKEIKHINASLDTDEITVENAITKAFHKILQLQLDPIWHQLSSKTKLLVADLKTLRLVLMYLTRYDCVTFSTLVNSLRTTESAMKSSGWQLLDSAETLFVASKRRVLGKGKTDDESGINPEVNPKWELLSDILEEVNDLCKKLVKNDPTFNNKVLVLVEDSKTCSQLKQYLTIGAKEMLLNFYKKAYSRSVRHGTPEKSKVSTDASVEKKDEELETDADEDYKDNYILSQKIEEFPDCGKQSEIQHELVDDPCTSQERDTKDENEKEKDVRNEETESKAKPKQQYEECEEVYLSQDISNSQPLVFLQAFRKQGDPLCVLKVLNEIQPRFVILYDSEPSLIRRLEVYQSNNPEIQLNVYFMVFGGSVEEQAFLTALRHEKESFDFLIKEKATMVMPEDQDGKSEDCAELSRDQSRPNMTVGLLSSSRKGGLESQTKKKPSTIIVDMREFRSELPSLIHKRGIEIEPVTLQVGDYILSPELCVERKSVSDLIGSLNSGRLYNQALAMSRHYSQPVLLIEFDQNKPFALQGCYFVSSDISSNDVVAKLQLLTLHFPKLKLVWSPSPYATAQLFEELKQGKDEPNSSDAAEVGLEQDETEILEKWNPAIHDLVTRLPGVTTKNLRSLVFKGQSLDRLLSLSLSEIAEIVNNSTEAKALYEGLHKTYQPQDDSRGTYKGRGKGRLPFKRRKL